MTESESTTTAEASGDESSVTIEQGAWYAVVMDDGDHDIEYAGPHLNDAKHVLADRFEPTEDGHWRHRECGVIVDLVDAEVPDDVEAFAVQADGGPEEVLLT